ncbi:MAG: hypothetical protein U1E01_04130 [Methylicorpusculum sp.]|nr:hypothetical protein [Methylicorpusculum sp.]
MKNKMKKISDYKNDKVVLESDLLSHVFGGLDESIRCDCDICKYNDTVYVKPIVIKPKE